jgi:exodeoxyribonuclease VII small subunit
VSLEDSFKLYKEGMKLIKFCNDKIDKVEKQVLKLNENGELDEF